MRSVALRIPSSGDESSPKSHEGNHEWQGKGEPVLRKRYSLEGLGTLNNSFFYVIGVLSLFSKLLVQRYILADCLIISSYPACLRAKTDIIQTTRGLDASTTAPIFPSVGQPTLLLSEGDCNTPVFGLAF